MSGLAVLRLLRPYPGRVLLAALFGFALGISGWATSRYLQTVLEGAPPFTAAMIAIAAIRAVMAVARRALQLGLVRRIEGGLARDFVRKALDVSGFDPPDLLGRLRGLEHLRIALEDRALGVAFDSVLLLVAAGVLTTYSPALAGLAVLGTLLPAIVVFFVRWSIQRSFAHTQETSTVLSRTCLDAFEGARDLRLFSGGTWMAGRVGGVYEASQGSRSGHHVKLALIGNATSFLSTVVSLALLHVGSHFVTDGHLTGGELMFVYTMAGSMLGPLENLVISWIFFDEAEVALRRHNEVMVHPVMPRGGHASPSTSISLSDVGFEYRPGQPVLSDISLEIPEETVVAIVGESGAGKSTLLGLLAGVLQPTRGQVRVEGSAAAVLQAPHLFDATVDENIRLGLAWPDESDIVLASTAARADDFIRKLPKGYATRLGNGMRLSAGQAQRICLARAFLRSPRILLLDEATSNVDLETEEAILESMRSAPGRTTVLVTHRVKTSQRADLIVVMHDGRIVEQGSFDSLLARDGWYAALWRRQFGAQ